MHVDNMSQSVHIVTHPIWIGYVNRKSRRPSSAVPSYFSSHIKHAA